MDSSIELQKQIKDNAEDLRRFVSDLSSWETEMKRKEFETCGTSSSGENSVPPVRNVSKKRDCGDSKVASFASEPLGVKKRISSSDYAAWEKFDVDKACEDVDHTTKRQSTESEQEEKIREKRLRDEANVEKEKGNQFVKKEKWDCAIECYSKAIKCYSRDAIYYCNRALCYLKKKDYRAAETDCTSALVLDNTYVKALHRRALARKELNQLEEAEADLLSACEIEPSNTAITRDYNAVRLMILDTIVTTQAETEVILMEKKPEPILPAKKHRPLGSSQKDSSDKKQSSCSIIWPNLKDSVVIEPVNIPPHKRSKKPLKRIEILDDSASCIASTSRERAVFVQAASDTSANSRHEAFKNHVETEQKQESVSPSSSRTFKLKQSISISDEPSTNSSTQSTFKLEVASSPMPKVEPAIPKNSVQFIAGWRQIRNNNSMCYQYLKQIDGKDFPKIFQDSLDGNIVSQILKVLSIEFVTAKEPVLSYLQGLTKVKRFRTLTLFLSQSDKESLDVLFKHAQNLENTSPDVIADLKKEYEL